jgi:hypothetical protein
MGLRKAPQFSLAAALYVLARVAAIGTGAAARELG